MGFTATHIYASCTSCFLFFLVEVGTFFGFFEEKFKKSPIARNASFPYPSCPCSTPSFLPSFLHSFIHSLAETVGTEERSSFTILPSFAILPSFLPSFPPSFLSLSSFLLHPFQLQQRKKQKEEFRFPRSSSNSNLFLVLTTTTLTACVIYMAVFEYQKQVMFIMTVCLTEDLVVILTLPV